MLRLTSIIAHYSYTKLNSDYIRTDIKIKMGLMIDKTNRDVNEDFARLLQTGEKLGSLATKMFSLIKWITNMSIAFLGFYIALLLQLKFNNNDVTTFFSITVILFLMFTVIFGLIYNFVYETLNIKRQIALNEFVHKVYLGQEKIVPEKGRKDLKWDQLKLLSPKLIGAYIILFISSFGLMAAYLLQLLFY